VGDRCVWRIRPPQLHNLQGDVAILVLSRRQNERILIGDNIVVTVVDIRGGRIKIGIEATKDVKILRGEVAERIEREQERAA
jgi:carbon storage regulator